MNEITDSLPQDLANAVHGDLRAFSRLQLRSHEDLQQARESLGELVVAAEDVRRVLLELLERKISPEQAQSWAFFIRQGYIGHWQSQPITDEVRTDHETSGSHLLAVHRAVPTGHSGPIRPIDIEYDLATEDSIADAISRLDDIGTAIEGEITESEITDLLRPLAHRREELHGD